MKKVNLNNKQKMFLFVLGIFSAMPAITILLLIYYGII